MIKIILVTIIITVLLVVLIEYFFIKRKLSLIDSNLKLLANSNEPGCVNNLSTPQCSVIVPMNDTDMDAYLNYNYKDICLSVCKFIAFIGTSNKNLINFRPNTLVTWTKDPFPIAIVYNNVGYDNATIVIFRGTLTSADVMEDLNFAEQVEPAKVNGTSESLSGIKVHGGFNAIYQNIKSQFSIDITKPVYISGHSLGCSLALLLGYDLITQGCKDVNIINFAPPRTGNEAFASFISSHSNIISFINIADIVPTMPPSYITSKMVDYQYSHPHNISIFDDPEHDLLACHSTLTYYNNIKIDLFKRTNTRNLFRSS